MKAIEWHSEEYPHRPKTPDWYWGYGSLGVLGAFVSFYFENYLFGILLIILTLVFLYYGAKPPQVRKYKIDGSGVQAGGEHHPFKELVSFSIIHHKGEKTLVLEHKKLIGPLVSIPLGKMQETIVREHLKRRLPEKEREKPLAEAIADSVGF